MRFAGRVSSLQWREGRERVSERIMAVGGDVWGSEWGRSMVVGGDVWGRSMAVGSDVWRSD